MKLRGWVIVLAGLVLGHRTAAAQEVTSEPGVVLRADCPVAIPPDLPGALELELQERLVVDGPGDVVVRITTPCEHAGRELTILVEAGTDVRLGPLNLEMRELGPRIRGRIAALWVAEHVRVARTELAAAASRPPAQTPPAPAQPTPLQPAPAAAAPAERVDPGAGLAAPTHVPSLAAAAIDGPRLPRERRLVRGSFALALHHDFVASSAGPGADVRLELGVRGKPGVALELGVGGSGLGQGEYDVWTELRASLGCVLDVELDHEWGTSFGVRALFVHEVYTAPGGFGSTYRIDDPVDIRASAFAIGRLYVYEGLSVFGEVELGALLVSFMPGRYPEGRQQNAAQGILRVGLGLD